jgi:hypothetical protein
MRAGRVRSSGSGADATSGAALTTSASLPAWFAENRVQGHTRLGIRLLDTPEFEDAAAGFKALGAGAFTRHVKSGKEGPWWPSAAPVGAVQDRNVAKEMIDQAHAEGLEIITYYWHMGEKTYVDLRPEWVCKDTDRVTPITDRRGADLDITEEEYREVVLTRLLELAEMGTGGFFFDSEHLPLDGCWGSALENTWREVENGQDAPTPPDTNPRYLEFIRFKARKIEETFNFWRDKVKAKHPEVVFVVSTTTIPALTHHAMTTRLARIADSPKNEYLLALRDRFNKRVFKNNADLAVPPGHVRQALGWTVLRDSADGRPPHVWAPGLPNTDHAQAFAASLLTFGCIANMDVDEQSLLGAKAPTEGKTPLDALKKAFALGKTASPHLAHANLLRWAAIHFGERNRNAREANYRRAWQEVLWPLVGAYQVLTEDGLPVGIVNDHQLEQSALDGHLLLVLPNSGPDDLTDGQQRAINAFEAGSGVVIRNKPEWAWSDPDGTDAAAAALRAAIRPHLATAPVQVTGGPTGRYAISYRRRGRLVVAVTNDFSWVQTTQPGDVPPKINPPAPPAVGVHVTWRKGHGLPQIPGGTPRRHRLEATEVISGEPLTVEELDRGYRVTLPTFSFMALLVVTRTPHHS